MSTKFDGIKWRGLFRCEKFWTPEYDEGCITPYDVIEAENLLLTAGATAMWQRLCGQGSNTVFDATNSYIAVGIGNAAAAANQTDLQGATKTRQVVDSAPVVSGAGVTFLSTFGTSTANHAWEEAGVVNASTAGVMLNRVVQPFGTKSAGMTWVLTGAFGLA